MNNILEKINSFKIKHYRNMMIQMQRESLEAANQGDHPRSVELYYRYLHYKHKYIKAGGQV